MDPADDFIGDDELLRYLETFENQDRASLLDECARASGVPSVPPKQDDEVASVDGTSARARSGKRDGPEVATMEKQRAKNRRTQARYRERQKEKRVEVEDRICTLRAQLTAASQARSELQEQKHELTARCATSANMLLTLHAQHAAAPSSAHRPCPSSGLAPDRLPPVSAPALHSHLGMTVPPCRRACALWPRHSTTHRPFSSFPAVATVSYDTVGAAHRRAPAPPGCGALTAPGSPTAVERGMSRYDAHATCYVAAAARRVGVPVEDLAILHEGPFRTTPEGDLLGFSTVCGSAECAVSVFMVIVGTIMGAFLLLGSATTLRTALERCQRGEPPRLGTCTDLECLKPTALAAAAAAAPPNPALRCATGACVPVAVAVPYVLSDMLRDARRVLPRADWRGRVARMLAMARGMGTPVYKGQIDASCAADTILAGGVEGIRAAQVATATFLDRVIAEDAAGELGPGGRDFVPSDVPWTAEDVERALEKTHESLQQLRRVWTSASYFCYSHGARVVRQIVFAIRTSHDMSWEESERLNMDTFARLRLTREQLVFLGGLWRAWTAARHTLHGSAAAAAARLDELPTAATIPSSFLLVLHQASGGAPKAAVAAAAGAAAAPRPPLRPPGRWRAQVDTSWARGLLGPSVAAVEAAGRSLEALRRNLEDDASLFARFRMAMLDSPHGFTCEQAMGLLTHKLEGTSFATDKFRMLQMAASKLKRSVLLPR